MGGDEGKRLFALLQAAVLRAGGRAGGEEKEVSPMGACLNVTLSPSLTINFTCRLPHPSRLPYSLFLPPGPPYLPH